MNSMSTDTARRLRHERKILYSKALQNKIFRENIFVFMEKNYFCEFFQLHEFFRDFSSYQMAISDLEKEHQLSVIRKKYLRHGSRSKIYVPSQHIKEIIQIQNHILMFNVLPAFIRSDRFLEFIRCNHEDFFEISQRVFQPIEISDIDFQIPMVTDIEVNYFQKLIDYSQLDLLKTSIRGDAIYFQKGTGLQNTSHPSSWNRVRYEGILDDGIQRCVALLFHRRLIEDIEENLNLSLLKDLPLESNQVNMTSFSENFLQRVWNPRPSIIFYQLKNQHPFNCFSSRRYVVRKYIAGVFESGNTPCLLLRPYTGDEINNVVGGNFGILFFCLFPISSTQTRFVFEKISNISRSKVFSEQSELCSKLRSTIRESRIFYLNELQDFEDPIFNILKPS